MLKLPERALPALCPRINWRRLKREQRIGRRNINLNPTNPVAGSSTHLEPDLSCRPPSIEASRMFAKHRGVRGKHKKTAWPELPTTSARPRLLRCGQVFFRITLKFFLAAF